jgi:hypothetical protein
MGEGGICKESAPMGGNRIISFTKRPVIEVVTPAKAGVQQS